MRLLFENETELVSVRVEIVGTDTVTGLAGVLLGVVDEFEVLLHEGDMYTVSVLMLTLMELVDDDELAEAVTGEVRTEDGEEVVSGVIVVVTKVITVEELR